MDPHRPLIEYSNSSRSITVEAIVSYKNTPCLSFDDFFESLERSGGGEGWKNVPLNAYFTMRFKVNDMNLALHLPSLVDCDCLHSLINDSKGDRMVEDLGEREATSRGFRLWHHSENAIKTRVLLLRITDPFLEYNLDKCRYNSNGKLNKGYCRGDGSSWQRYTDHPPLPCMVHVEPLDYLARIMPDSPLEADCYYALLLQNGVPCPPDCELDGPLLNFSHCPGVGDDKLFFFSTEKESSAY